MQAHDAELPLHLQMYEAEYTAARPWAPAGVVNDGAPAADLIPPAGLGPTITATELDWPSFKVGLPQQLDYPAPPPLHPSHQPQLKQHSKCCGHGCT